MTQYVPENNHLLEELVQNPRQPTTLTLNVAAAAQVFQYAKKNGGNKKQIANAFATVLRDLWPSADLPAPKQLVRKIGNHMQLLTT